MPADSARARSIPALPGGRDRDQRVGVGITRSMGADRRTRRADARAAVSCNGIDGNGCSETLPLLWLAVPLLVTAGVYGYSAWYGLDAIHRCNAAALGPVLAPPRP